MRRLLFITLYVDHILYFFLDQLSRELDLTIVVDKQNQWTERLAADGRKIHRLSPRGRFDKSFRNELEALKSDNDWSLIQCFHGNPQLSNAICWNRKRLPLVAYRARIGHLKFRENPTAYWNARNPSLAAVAAVSSQVKRYLESFRILPARNVHVMHHGINRQWVQQQITEPYGLRERLGIPDDALIVASLAALRPVKRFEYVVHAAGKLRDEPVHFVHIGDPAGWDARAAHLPKVHFLGPQGAPLPILAEADVFAMTSHNEAFGRANLEAMACGKAVIGSNTGGLLDLVDPGVTGQLFDTRSPEAFTAIVRNYADDRDAVEQHGRNAIERVDRLFSTESMTQNYLNLYREVLAARDALT